MPDFYTKFKRSLVLIMLLAIPGVYAQVNTYSFTTASSVYTPLSGGTVLATATGTSGAASLDDVVYSLPAGSIPFNFNFNGTNYTTCYVSTNGFITFGTTAPAASGSATGYTPLSATTAYSGAASPLGRNLNAYFFTGNAAQTGELRYETLGSSPNRIFVVQYKNFKTFNTSGTTYGPVINLQIRLLETSNALEFVYNCSGSISSATAQVGLRGANSTFPTNINNRSVAASVNTWATSTAGTSNTSTCEISGTLLPASGLVYRFAPVLCPSAQNLLATNITQTTAQLTWSTTVSGSTFTVEYGPAGFTPGTGTIISNAVSPVNISGLTQNTAYTFTVQQNCGANGLSLVASSNFSSGTIGEDCATAPSITVASSLANCNYTTITSGVSANGPNAICSDAIGGKPDDDRWVKFVAPSNGNKLVISTTAGTNNDWVMEVWSACGGTAIKCGDDNVGYMPLITLCQNEYVGGQTYYIRAWTYNNGVSGTMNLCVYEDGQCNIPPVNDECADAIRVPVNQPLSCPGNAQVFNTNFATVNAASATCDASNKRDMYFVFNTGSYNAINIQMSPLTATTLKAQILFECGSFEVACWNPANGTFNFTGFNPVADYILRVWSDSATSGTFSLCISATCSNPTAVISGAQTVCTGTAASLNVAMTGIAPYTFVYSNGVANTTVTTSSANYTLSVSPTVTTTYTLVSMNDASCAGGVSGSGTITVVNPQTVTLAPFTAICSNASPVILTGGSPAGGLYSGTNVSNGAFNPSGGTKTITYTVTYAPGCTRGASQSYPVLTAPSAALSSLGVVCNTSPAYPLTGGSPAGGVYSGPGVSNNEIDPAVAGPGTHVIYYTYTASNGCSATANNTIMILDCGCGIAPTADAGPDLQSCGGTAVTITGSIGGSATTLTWINGSGTYSPNVSSATITYTPSAAEISAGFAMLILVTDDPDGPDPCVAAMDTMLVNITAAPAVTLASFTPVCINAGLQTLIGGSPTGGVYSGINVSNGQFNPSGGSQTITYTVTYSAGCSRNASKVFTVNPLPAVTMSAVGTYCTTDAPFTLTQGSPSGGTYSGVGVSNNVFSPSVAGVGTKTITYTYTNANGCTNSASNSVVVNSCVPTCTNPAVANAGADKSICYNTTSVAITGAISGSASSATWSGGTGTYSPNSTTLAMTYTPSTIERNAGFARLFLTTNDPDGTGPCVAGVDTVLVNINAVPALSGITGNNIICRPATGQVFSVNSQIGVTYAWTVPTNYTIASGQGTNSITVNINSSASSGTIAVTGSNSCGSSSASIAITLRTAVPGTVGGITGTNTACPGDSFQYKVAKLSTADYYLWYPPIGGTINGSSSVVNTTDTAVWVLFTASFTGDTLKIKGGNCKGISTTFRTYAISKRISAPGTPGTISGPFENLCGVTSATYSITAVTGAKTYTWRGTVAGMLFNGQSGPVTTTGTSVTVTYPASWGTGVTTGNLYVKSNNACGSSTERTLAIKTPPTKPGAITGSTSVCTGATNVAYSITTVTGATSYLWTIPSGITLVSGQGTTSILVNFNTTAATRTLRVAAVNACGSGTQSTLSVTSAVCPAARIGQADNLNVEVYPNPVKDLLNIKLESPDNGDYMLSLYDMEGSLVRIVPVPVIAGVNTISLEVTGLRSGLYLLQVEGKDGSRQLRIMIE